MSTGVAAACGGLGIRSLRGPGSQWPRLDRKMCVIGVKDQTLAPTAARGSPERRSREYSFPQAEGSPSWAKAGVLRALLRGPGDR